MQIAPAQPEDFGWVSAELDRPDALSRLKPITPDQIATRLAGGDIRLWIGRQDGARAAFALLTGFSAPSPDWVRVEKIMASNPGTGQGSAFLTALLTDIDAMPSRPRILLRVVEDNPGAVRFYERFGFVVTGLDTELFDRRDGGPCTLTLMKRTGAA